MAYRKRTSTTLEKAHKRSLSIKSIDPYLDLGNGLTAREFAKTIDDTQQKIDSYNLALSSLTQLYNEMMESEKILADQHERMLSGVLAKFGRNSTEYEMAGGSKRTGKRKARTSKPIANLPTVNDRPEIIITPTQSPDPKPQALNAMMN
jgi:hypothetical protein